MKILQAPSNVANQSTANAVGLEALGHDVEIWNYGESPNGFRVDKVFNPEVPKDYFDILGASLEASFDVFHFHTSRSLVPARGGVPQMWDLPLLRAMGKTVVVSFHGSDVRKASHHVDDDRWSFYRFADIPSDEEKIDTRLGIIKTFAHRMTVASVLDQIYVPEATYFPKSLDLSQYEMSALAARRRPIVLHATRRRATKGTDIIEAELENLRESLDFEVRIVEGASHTELLQEMKQADIVVEKLLGGDAGVLSLEAMALGKVAVARIRDEVYERHPNMPVVNANPETFRDVMGELLWSPQRRAELGEAGRKYVEADHSAEAAGRFLEELYTSSGPRGVRPHPDWASDPSPRRLEAAYERISQLEATVARLKARKR